MKTYNVKLTAEEISVVAFSLGTAIGTLHKQADWDKDKLTTSKPSTKFMESCNEIMRKINETKGEQ